MVYEERGVHGFNMLEMTNAISHPLHFCPFIACWNTLNLLNLSFKNAQLRNADRYC